MTPDAMTPGRALIAHATERNGGNALPVHVQLVAYLVAEGPVEVTRAPGSARFRQWMREQLADGTVALPLMPTRRDVHAAVGMLARLGVLPDHVVTPPRGGDR